jgi:hypothetical protein
MTYTKKSLILFSNPRYFRCASLFCILRFNVLGLGRLPFLATTGGLSGAESLALEVADMISQFCIIMMLLEELRTFSRCSVGSRRQRSYRR